MLPFARRAAFALVVLVACETSDPFDSATNNTTVSAGPGGGPGGGSGGGPGGGPGGGSNDMTEGTGVTDGTTDSTTDSVTDGTTATAPTTSTGEPETTMGATLSHAIHIQPIWDASCAPYCHTLGGTGATWFILDEGVAYDELVNVSSLSFPELVRIVPGDPDNSYLWHKINDTHVDFGGGGTSMPPPPSAPLSDDDRDTIRQWILEGCPP